MPGAFHVKPPYACNPFWQFAYGRDSHVGVLGVFALTVVKQSSNVSRSPTYVVHSLVPTGGPTSH